MIGQIISYDEIGLGEILGEDKNIYLLNINNWRDYKQPSVDSMVKFIPNNKAQLAIQIKLLSQDEILNENFSFSQSNEKEDSVSNNKIDIKYIDKIDLKDFQQVEKISFIPITTSFVGVFNDFYEEAIEYGKDKKLDDYKYDLDYILMRRFVLTTFKNLQEKDASFASRDILDTKNRLEKLYLLYNDLNSKIANYKVFFEKTFLKYQDIYLAVDEKFKHNNALLSKLDDTAKELDKFIKKKSAELVKISRSSSAYNETDTSIKQARTKYANCIDKLGILKKENDVLLKLINDFKEKYEINFLEFFKENSEKLLSVITVLMKKYAHYFDVSMWEGAKKSVAVKKFFVSSQIEGSFSSRTFLRYYLSRLDVNKAKADIKELQKLLDYLDSQDRKNVLIVDSRSNLPANLKFFINHIDSFLKATSMSHTQVSIEMSNINANFFLVYIDKNSKDELEFLKTLQYVHKDAKIVLLSDNFNPKFVQITQKMGINDFIITKDSEHKVFSALTKILLDSDEQELLKIK